MHDTMSMVQQVINDARMLATRLTEHDSTVDSLLAKTQVVFKLVECKKEYCEEMNELNEAANGRQRSALIKSIQEENRNIRELQKENKELRQALEEHQNITELIMSKYREQVTNLIVTKKTSHSSNSEEQEKIANQMEKISEMAMLMRRAVDLQEKEENHQREIVASLLYENKGLREMLHIANRSGSLCWPEQTDAHTQTDHLAESEEDSANKENHLGELTS